MKGRRLAFLGVLSTAVVLVAVAVVLGGGGVGGGGGATEGVAADPAHTPPPQTRVLVVSRSMPAPSRPGTTLHGRLERGPMPHAPMHGTVLTDSECAPDAHGVSRCRNEVRLADGSTIVVRHPHDMAQVPCLSPGEPVRVSPS